MATENEKPTALLPCPFCGSGRLNIRGWASPRWVACLDCEAAGPAVFGAEDAVGRWNAAPRPAPAPAAEKLDLLDVALAAIKAKRDAVPRPRSYEMAHYCMGLEDAMLAVQAKIQRRGS
jgi:hypothetical protein